MGNDVTTKEFCKSCKKELPANHSGPCPICGEEKKEIKTEIREKIVVTESYRGKVERPGYPKPILEERVTNDISGKTGNPVEKMISINRLKQKKKHEIRDKKEQKVIHAHEDEFSEIKCPKCGSREITKEVISEDKTKYFCKNCGEIFGDLE